MKCISLNPLKHGIVFIVAGSPQLTRCFGIELS
jgi:hypothetical protein